jgi:eukaryotic-like serine/threonine-protein kinase
VKSDLYGVGAILWEMLTGEKPQVGRAGNAVTLRTRPSGVHRDLDVEHDALVLSFLSQQPAARPEDAFAARRALGALLWPNTIERAAPQPSLRPKSVRPVAGRLALGDDGGGIDTWLGRRVDAIPLDDGTLARASAFARADHPALQLVLRVDREGRAIWLATPRGAPLAAALAPEQARLLREALDRLHEIGEVHGSVDPAHFIVDDAGAVTLAFAGPPGPTATRDTDRLALARLGGSP